MLCSGMVFWSRMVEPKVFGSRNSGIWLRSLLKTKDHIWKSSMSLRREGGKRRGGTALLLLATALRGAATESDSDAQLLEPARAGETMLVLSDCSRVARGQRLRLGRGGAAEEEGEVISLRCPSALAASSATAADPAFGRPKPCEAADVDSQPAHCREILEAASRLPGLADSYRAAKRAKLQLAAGALQPEGGAHATGSVAGVAILRNGLLFAHEVGDTVHAYARPHGQGLTRAPAVPQLVACADGCGHGACNNGTCACHEGYGGLACTELACAGGCNGRGTCLRGTCACEERYHGATCLEASASVQGSSCPNGCANGGRCAQGRCLCQSRFIGATCLTEVNDCPAGCSSNGRCRNGACECYSGYFGPSCGDFCPHNCSDHLGNLNGRCSAAFKCICKMGFSGSDCTQTCPNRCSGHGECYDGQCTCYEGYEGPECST